jgi:HlyD family secretion protein
VTQNVVTYVVVVTVDNSDLKLKPGMTANVSIEVDRKENVLKLPPAALRFKPKNDSADAKGGKHPATIDPAVKGGGRDGVKGSRKGKGPQVYILKEDKPAAVPVKTGIANGTAIELTDGDLKEGDEVIIEQTGGGDKKKASALGGSPMGPRMQH